jgi:hypothetical protein
MAAQAPRRSSLTTKNSALTEVLHREHEHGAVCRPVRRQEGKKLLEVFVFLLDKK